MGEVASLCEAAKRATGTSSHQDSGGRHRDVRRERKKAEMWLKGGGGGWGTRADLSLKQSQPENVNHNEKVKEKGKEMLHYEIRERYRKQMRVSALR